MLVAADAARRLARLDRRETLHPLDRQALVVQGHEQQAPQGRGLEKGRAVGLDRHRPQHPLQSERARVAQGIHAAGEVDRLGQALDDHQLLDLAGPDAGHVAAAIDVFQQVLARRLGQIDPRRDGELDGVGHDRPRFVQPDRAELLRRGEERRRLAAVVHQHQPLVFGRHEGRRR